MGKAMKPDNNNANYWAKMEVISHGFDMQDLLRFCLGDFI